MNYLNSHKIKLTSIYCRFVLICVILFTTILYSTISASNSKIGEEYGFIFSDKNKKAVKIPVEIHNNLILIPLKINNSLTLNFILDSGAKTTILTEPIIADLLNLKISNSIKIKGFGDLGELKAEVAHGVNVNLPGVTGSNISLVILPDGLLNFTEICGKPVYGIIGWDLFRQFAIEINYINDYIVLHQPNKIKHNRSKKAITVPIKIESSKPYIQGELVDFDGNLIKQKLLIDTGSSQALTLHPKNKVLPKKTIDTYIGQGISGDIFGKLGRLPGIKIDRFLFSEIFASYPNLSENDNKTKVVEWDGNIGGELLQRFTTTIDYPNKCLILKPNSKFGRPFNYNISGLEIIARGANFTNYFIQHVSDFSPASLAGVQPGDQIIQVNRAFFDDAQLGDVYYAINKTHGSKICLKLKRNGKIIKSCFVLKDHLIEE